MSADPAWKPGDTGRRVSGGPPWPTPPRWIATIKPLFPPCPGDSPQGWPLSLLSSNSVAWPGHIVTRFAMFLVQCSRVLLDLLCFSNAIRLAKKFRVQLQGTRHAINVLRTIIFQNPSQPFNRLLSVNIVTLINRNASQKFKITSHGRIISVVALFVNAQRSSQKQLGLAQVKAVTLNIGESVKTSGDDRRGRSEAGGCCLIFRSRDRTGGRPAGSRRHGCGLPRPDLESQRRSSSLGRRHHPSDRCRGPIHGHVLGGARG